MPSDPRFRRSLRLRIPRLPAVWLRVAVPACAAALVLGACNIVVYVPDDEEEPCVKTHQQGCLPDAEFEALAEEVAVDYAESESFQIQWGLEAINADRAYANLELQFGPDAAPGDGVTVGVLDTGIDGAHPSFRDKNVVERFLPGARDEVGDESSHGTAVASIIAGEDIPGFPFDSHGVAWGADLVVFALPLGQAPELYDPIQVSELPGTAAYFTETFREILGWRFGDRGIDFLNLSLGSSGIVENYGEEIVREHFAPLFPVMLQEGSDEKVVFVWAAGNEHGTTCDIPIPQCIDGAVDASSVVVLAGLGARMPALQEALVAVVAIRPDGEIADFSNRCGIAADYCLAAPGADVRVSYFGPGRDGTPVRATGTAGGTSLAAPMVTGGLAMMKSYFRSQLSNTDLLARLLETADRSGLYADASIYGRGLMDLGAATSPVGDSMVALGDRVGGPAAVLQGTSLNLGLAFGDALVSALGEREIAAFDALGAPFWYDVGGFVAVAAGPSLSQRYRDFQRMWAAEPYGSPTTALRLSILELSNESGGALPALHLARAGASAAAKASHFALAGNSVVATLPLAANLSASALTSDGLDGQEPATGAALTWRAPEAPLGLRAGWMGERHTALGSESDGAFGNLAANAVFAGLEADEELGRWRIGGSAEIGTVNAETRGGVLSGLSPLATSAFTLHATRRSPDGGALRVWLSQPLRVEDGEALLALPSGRTTAGEVARRALNLDVEPAGRQIDLALQWQRPLAIGELSLGATLSRQPGHRRNADTELVALAGWRHAF